MLFNCLFTAALIAPVCWPAQSAPAAEQPSPGSADRGFSLSPAPFPPGASDEEGYVQELSRRTQALFDLCQRTPDSGQRLNVRLAAVNWILAVECEPPLSRLVQGISLKSQADRIVELAGRCLAELATAREEVQALAQAPDSDGDDESLAGLEETIDLLETFARGLEACFAHDDSEEADATRRSAATDLSRFLEDARPNVAAAALLCQTVLYARADRVDRALRLLPPAMKPPGQETISYDFFARLTRCRYLTQQGRFAAAWSLLAMLEERCQEWFTDQARRAEATRSVVLTRLDVCEAWTQKGDAPSAEATRSWCQKMDQRLRDHYFPPDGDRTLFRLATAAPLVVDIPDPQTIPASPPEPAPADDTTHGQSDAGTDPGS